MIKVEQFKSKCPCDMHDLKSRIAKKIGHKPEELRNFKILRRSVDARKKPELFYVYSAAFTVPDEKKLLKKKVRGFVVSEYHERSYEFPNVIKNLKERNASSADTSVQAVSSACLVHGLSGNCEKNGMRPIIVGSGPAGLFCALMLSRAGMRPIVLERGHNVDDRMKAVNAFWQGGRLDPESNVQFGEGGAGTFSDGKLNTSIHDRAGMSFFVLQTFVKYGAPEEILYDSHPHIGTDVLAVILKKMRADIISMGGEFRFDTCVTDLEIKSGKITGLRIRSCVNRENAHQAESSTKGNHFDIKNKEEKSKGLGKVKPADSEKHDFEVIHADKVILAIGHSARDTFEMLKNRGVLMQPKPFAVGLRVQHPQEMIDVDQYGFSGRDFPCPASYKLTHHTGEKRGVYSFCMCPGGYVVNASSEEGLLAVNGMSYSGRASGNANSAIVVAVSPKDYMAGRKDEILGGIEFQRELERRAYQAAGGRIPAETFADFKNKSSQRAFGDIEPCTKGLFALADVRSIMPEYINEAFIDGMEAFGRKMEGFSRRDTILYGIESRTSSPVQILRNENYLSNIEGLYPCGEGAGYAGGIVSAAVDGIKIAAMVAESR